MTPLLAHGLGDAGALPVPLPLVLLGVTGAVLGVGVALDRRSVMSAPAPDDLILLERAGSTAVATALGAVGLLLGLGVPALAAVGSGGADQNPAARLVLSVLLPLLVVVPLAWPGVWRALNPLRAATALLNRATGDAGEQGARPLPEGLGWWPAAAGLGAFLALEAALPPDPTPMLLLLLGYALIHLAAAAFYGSVWYAHGDAFEVLAEVSARLSPVRRDADGRLGLGNPADRLAIGAPPGATAVVAVLVGSALADFVTDLPNWLRTTRGAGRVVDALLELAVLAGCALLVAGLVRVAARGGRFLPALLALVPAYLFAHWFAVFLVEGLAALGQLGVLVRQGLHTVTGAELVANYELLPAGLASTLQLAGFLAPHLLAVAAGDRLATAWREPVSRRAAQVPLRAVLTVSALGGVALRFSAA